jgi:hypothetical protein
MLSCIDVLWVAVLVRASASACSWGQVLGVPDPKRQYAPYDDRIVELTLDCTRDAILQHDMHLDMWWRAVDEMTLPTQFDMLT